MFSRCRLNTSRPCSAAWAARSRASLARRFTYARVSVPAAGANSSATAAPTAAPATKARRTVPLPIPWFCCDIATSEDADLHIQVFFRIGRNRRNQLPQLSHRGVHVLIQLFVVEQLAGGAFALLQRGRDLIHSVHDRIHPVIQLTLGEQRSSGPLPFAQAG